jgi:hypothetical protein
MSAAFHLFFGKVAQHGTPQGSVPKPGVQGAEKGWKGSDMMKVFNGMGAQMLKRKLACTPSLVEGMTEEVVARDTLIERGLKLTIHGLTKTRSIAWGGVISGAYAVIYSQASFSG